MDRMDTAPGVAITDPVAPRYERNSLLPWRRSVKGETAVAASPSWSNGLQILGGRLAGLAVNHDLERDTLAFSELTQAGAFNGADMDEHILAAAFGLDESRTSHRSRRAGDSDPARRCVIARPMIQASATSPSTSIGMAWIRCAGITRRFGTMAPRPKVT